MQGWLAAQAEHRKEDFLHNTTISLPVRLVGASIPIIAFAIMVWTVYKHGDSDRIYQNSGATMVEDWSWTVSQYAVKEWDKCLEQRCWQEARPVNSKSDVTLPDADPVALKEFKASQGKVFVYRTEREPSNEILYIPGIFAKQVYGLVDDKLSTSSQGNMQYFVDLNTKQQSTSVIEIVTVLNPYRESLFQGFIRQKMFAGTPRVINNLLDETKMKKFPRQATVIFLLAIGALTFAFFLFMDQKRELFALGMTLSLLGMAYAILTGLLLVPGIPNSTVYFTCFVLHMTGLLWYTGELVRVTVKIPKGAIAFGVTVLLLYLPSKIIWADAAKPLHFWLFVVTLSVPILCGVICAVMSWFSYKGSKERATQLVVVAAGMVFYGVYLHADFFSVTYLNVMKSASEVPVLIVASSWVVAALASLGSLEKRVQVAVEDREQRQKLEHDVLLAQEVQKSFISIGVQKDPNYDVCTVYQAFKKVGGDWVMWRSLSDEYSVGIVGDVVGKGIQAGLIVSASDSILRNILRTRNIDNTPPEELVREIVADLFYSVIQPHEGRAMTLMVAVFDSNGRISYTTLGHPAMLAISPRKIRPIGLRHSWLSPDFDLDSMKIDSTVVEDDETLICYTDGICDGTKELRQFMRRIKHWHERELTSISAEFNESEPTYDDQTLFMLRRKKISEPKSA